MGRSGRTGGRARGTLPLSLIARDWPFAAELDVPQPNGLGVQTSARLTRWLAGRDVQRGAAGLATVRYHFRNEAEADAFTAEFAPYNGRRVTPQRP